VGKVGNLRRFSLRVNKVFTTGCLTAQAGRWISERVLP
jgi:hypothetical protein